MRVPSEPAQVYAVAASPSHLFSKMALPAIEILAGLGVRGDAHCGATVQHLFDRRRDPKRQNRRQIHLIGWELLESLAAKGFFIKPGALGENVTTRGLDLLSLPQGTRLQLGRDARVELTGLRQPCIKLDRLSAGLRAAVTRVRHGETITDASVMATAIGNGRVHPGDRIEILLPRKPHRALRCV